MIGTEDNKVHLRPWQQGTVCRRPTHHSQQNLIGDVPAVLAQAVGWRMAEYDRSFRHVQHLVHHSHGDMGQVDQHPQTVHFHDQLLPQQLTYMISVYFPPYLRRYPLFVQCCYIARKQLSRGCFYRDYVIVPCSCHKHETNKIYR